MGDKFIDKTYLALELTKIDSEKHEYSSHDLMTTYNYYLTQLCEIDNIAMIDDLKKENEDLKNVIEQLRCKLSEEKEIGMTKQECEALLEFIEQNKINMEPVVSQSLFSFINNCIK